MKSKDVQIKTGLTRKAIEYYEDIGLVSPSRDENGYRNYSDEEVSKLSLISMYRKLGVTLFEIKHILKSDDKEKTLSNIIRDREIRKEIDEKRLNLLRSSLHGSLIEDKLEAELFLSKLKRQFTNVYLLNFPVIWAKCYF